MVILVDIKVGFCISDIWTKAIRTCWLVVYDSVDGKDNLEEKTREVADRMMYHFDCIFLQLVFDMLW